MGRTDPGSDCLDLRFAESHDLGDSAEVALEDYARALSGSREAESIPDGSDTARVAGVHLCGAEAPAPALAADVEDFARELARQRENARGPA